MPIASINADSATAPGRVLPPAILPKGSILATLPSREGHDDTARNLCGVLANLGFKPAFLKQGGKQGCFPPTMRHGRRIGRVPCPLE
ncbi:MAG TPA: hypothetical protein VIM32_00045 [Desulfosporosinus sp.]